MMMLVLSLNRREIHYCAIKYLELMKYCQYDLMCWEWGRKMKEDLLLDAGDIRLAYSIARYLTTNQTCTT